MAITAKQAIQKAQSFIGTKENPPDSNNVVFNTEYYGHKVSGADYPWCCVFMWYLFMVLKASLIFCNGSKVSYCPTIEVYAKKHKQYFQDGKPGDLAIMDFGKNRASHIGIVKCKNKDGTYTTIEGNTSVKSNDNGGCVMERTRNESCIRGFYRPAYAGDSPLAKFIMAVQKAIGAEVDGEVGPETLGKCPTLKKGCKGPAVRLLKDKLKCGDKTDKFGVGTCSGVKKFQKKVGLKATGIVNTATWKTLFKE